MCIKLFSSEEEDGQHKLCHFCRKLNNALCYNFLAVRKYQPPHIKTKRYLKLFIPFCPAQAMLQTPTIFYTYFKLCIIVSYFKSVNYDRPGECSPEKDCLR